jgi:hypothetical protein
MVLPLAAALCLTGCVPSGDPVNIDAAMDRCLAVYEDHPGYLDIASQQKQVEWLPIDACASWVDEVGRDRFVEQWTDDAWVDEWVESLDNFES